MEVWRLDEQEMSRLLGYEGEGPDVLRALLHGTSSLLRHDTKDRIGYLLIIRRTLAALFQDIDAENEWLRTPHPALQGASPMDRMLDGALYELIRVSELVQHVAGL